MGFFSKIFKGVKKTFKKIGKGIKSAFAKVGKFMGKIGILGQIALGLMLPGIGGMLGKWAVTAMGSGNALVSAAGHFVNAAVNIGTKAGSVFKTVTEGVTKVIGETVGAALNVIPGADKLVLDVTKSLGVNAGQGINIGDKSFSSIFKVAGNAMQDAASAGRSLFSMDTLTGKNKYYLEAMKTKVAEAIPTSGEFSKAGIDTFDSTKPQMSGLNEGNTVDLSSPKITDIDGSNYKMAGNKIVDSNTVDLSSPKITDIDGSNYKMAGNKIVDSNTVDSILAKQNEKGFLATKISEGVDYAKTRADRFIPDAVDQTVNTLTDLPSQFIKKAADIGQAGDYIDRSSSTVVQLSDDLSSTSIRTGRIANFDPRAYESSQNLFDLNPYGNTAIQIAGREQYLNRMQQGAL